MTAAELSPNALFTAVGYEEWGTFKFSMLQGTTAMAFVMDETPKTWLPSPDAPVWLPAETTVNPL